MCFRIQLPIKDLVEFENIFIPRLTKKRRYKPNFLLKHVQKQFKLISKVYMNNLIIPFWNRHLNFTLSLIRIKDTNVKSNGVFRLNIFSYVSYLVAGLILCIELRLKERRILGLKHILNIIFSWWPQHLFLIDFLAIDAPTFVRFDAFILMFVPKIFGKVLIQK